MKPMLKLTLAVLLTAPMLASCGLRGGLARPAPIFGQTEPVLPPAPEPIAADTDARPEVVVRQRTNEFGGEIPDAAPTDPVVSVPLDDPDSDEE